MFWHDRDRGQQGGAERASGESSMGQQKSARRGPAPHVVVSGRQLREEILSYGPAFLEPHRFSEPDAFRALVTVLAAYALGSRTAARLVRERQMADPSWQPPSRREAMQVVSSLNRLRQYLPYLLGQRMQATTSGPPQPTSGSYSDNRPSAPPPAPPPPQPAYQPASNNNNNCQGTTTTRAGHGTPTSSTYQSQPTPVTNYHSTEVGISSPRAVRIAQPQQKISRPVVNTRPSAPQSSGVVVRPVISLNRRR